MTRKINILLATCLSLLGSYGIAAGMTITEDLAKSKALAAYPGKVLEVEKEKHKGDDVYSIEIKGKDGIREISVRISDGVVVDNKVDDGDEHEGEHN